jgi:allophanate hydrolase subunit 2
MPESGTVLDGIAPPDYAPDYPWVISVRVIPGPQDEQFTAHGIDTFFGSEYVVSDRSDRQGIRFDGPEIEAGPGGYDIVSDAIVTGSIQIPGDRRPIALLADRQTTGGYPKIGVVATADLPLLAQAAPGTRVRFARTGVDEAVEALREGAQEIERAVPVPPQLDSISVGIHGDSYEVALPRKSVAAGEGGPNLVQVEVNGTLYTVSIREEA